MGRYRGRQDYDDYADREPPRRRRPEPRSRAAYRDEYDRPSRSGGGSARRPPSRYAGRSPRDARTRSRGRDERRGMSPGVLLGLLANVAILLTIAVLYFGFPSTYDRLLHILTRTDPPLPKGADIVLLAHSVPWGTLSMDDGGAGPTPQPTGTALATTTAQPAPTGTALATTTPQATSTSASAGTVLHVAGTADGRPYYRLKRGTHTLSYIAAPFQPVRCTTSVPASKSDTCPLVDAPPSAATRPLGATRTLDVFAKLDILSADQRKALFDAVHAALASQPTNVQPYERYLNAAGQMVYTYQTLQATLYYDVNTDPAHAVDLPTGASGTPTPTATGSPAATATPSATATGTPTPPAKCVSMCEPPFQALAADAPTDTWNLFTNLAPAWQYTTNAGTVIAAHAPAVTGTTAPTTAILSVKWAGQWQVSLKDTDKAALLANAVGGMGTTLKLPGDWAYRVYPAQNPADGYLFVAGKSTGDANAPLAAPTAQVLYRFGVLVTGNSTAGITFPALPRGTLAERALAQQIATQWHVV